MTTFPQNNVFRGRFYHTKTAFEYLSALASYLEIEIQRKQFYIHRSGIQRIEALHYNGWHFVVSGNQASFKNFAWRSLNVLTGVTLGFTTDLCWSDIENLKLHFFTWVRFFHKNEWFCPKNISVNFESHKLLKAVFDVTRCALSNETNLDQIHCADMTKLLDLAEHVFSSW